MVTEVKSPLRQFREEFTHPKISQEAMARKIGVSLQWYRMLESSQQNTSYTTATTILSVLNAERQNRGLEAVNLDQLGLRIV